MVFFGDRGSLEVQTGLGHPFVPISLTDRHIGVAAWVVKGGASRSRFAGFIMGNHGPILVGVPVGHDCSHLGRSRSFAGEYHIGE